MTSRWTDSPARFGLVTRLFHWSVALLLGWQFAGMIIKLTVGRHPITAFLVGTHKPIGTVLMVLIAARAVWALLQWAQRPSYPATTAGKAAIAGHLFLYALMLYIPAVALLRQYGSSTAFDMWGLQVFGARGTEIAWMLTLADFSHARLAWLLLAVIVGHVLMVALHHWYWRDDTLHHMTGSLADKPPSQSQPNH